MQKAYTETGLVFASCLSICWGEGHDEIKLVQFFMKIKAYNLKYSLANSEEKGSTKSAH